ncbi:hypothetical protein [Amycolatopsis sp. NPDC004625]|uniref:hypothetical protein n=1 Tax=Amycolatopsis sp. NPDC004625 TaxID=3154670 RepID=UPI0033B2F35C
MAQNSASGRFTGPVIQAATVHGGVHIGNGEPARSYYLSRVESFAPRHLVDRDDELAELARFCTSPATAGTYAWWRADPWSGKSALLSTFVLEPPAGVQIVAFFITGSQPDQSDRRAFVDNLLEQLGALRGIPLPPFTESTRETGMLGLLAEVAQGYSRRGEQLALVVDGLDEDRGFDGSPDAHSIAALLPMRPPAGMRVIVSGRDSPPLPDDVPDDHPLREPAIVRRLAPSEEARAVRDAKERDLKRLLHGTSIEQALLGLLVAAAGGLTTPDLAELTGFSDRHIEDSLRTASGRSFARRPPERPQLAHDVHVLAHEQLLVGARSMLGPKVAHYRQRLHDWADDYAARRWPPETPEYLLRGYFAMLQADHDLPRMHACATDPHRHRLAFVRTGGDGAALGEISATQNSLLASEQPDLMALVRLAVHRVHLLRGNRRLPTSAPSGWAFLGQLDRAEAMIEAISNPADRIRALISTATVCHAAGETRHAEKMLDQAEAHAAEFNQFFGAGPVVELAKASEQAGDHQRARRVIALIGDSVARAEALAELAGHAADAGARDQADALLTEAEQVLWAEEPRWHTDGLGAMAVAAGKLGQADRAKSLLDEAEAVLDADSFYRTSFHAGSLARYAALAGDDERALRVVNTMDDTDKREAWLESIIRITAKRDVPGAEAIARESAQPRLLCAGLAAIASSSRTKNREYAARLSTEALEVAHLVHDPAQRLEALITVAAAVADTGDVDRAAAITREYAKLGTNADLVLLVAAAAFRAGEREVGAELLQLTEDVARRLVNEYDQRISVLWIRTMADREDFDRAEALAAQLTDQMARSSAWAAITEGALAANQLDRAERALSSVTDPALQRRPRLDVLRAALAAGQPALAKSIATNADDRLDRASALLLVARDTRDGDLFDEVGDLVDVLDEPLDTMSGLLGMVEVAAGWGDRDRTAATLHHLLPLAQAIRENLADESRSMSRVDNVLKLCAARIRSLTEVGEEASRLRKSAVDYDRKTATSAVPGRFPMTSTAGLSPDAALARQLVEHDWAYVVEELLERDPDAYSAIIAELDVLAGH